MTTTLTRVRETPWLGCGVSGTWYDIDDALEDAGQLYEVEQVNAYDDRGQRIPGVLVNRRIDTHEIVGSASDSYGVIQNAEGFQLLKPFLEADGVIEHAGITEQGMVFMVMRMPAQAFGFAGDNFDLYICAMNSFNTRFPMAVIITPIRVCCQNMFRRLMERSDAVLCIKHGSLAGKRMLAAAKATSLLTSYTNDFIGHLDNAASTHRSKTEIDRFIESMFPLVPVDAEHPRAASSNERIELTRSKFYNDYYLAPDNENYRNTSLGLLNAYYDWVSHSDPSRALSGNRNDRRFSNLMLGTAVKPKLIKQA